MNGKLNMIEAQRKLFHEREQRKTMFGNSRRISKFMIRTLKLLHYTLEKLYGKNVADEVVTRIEQNDR